MRNQDTQPQRNILEKENVFVIDAGGNRIEISGIWKVFCENVRDGYKYKSASINSKLNNKITVVGYNSWEEGNYFCPIEYGGLDSAMPVGFDKDKGNIVMPMIPLISSDTNGKESYSTASSFPTAVTSAVVGNAVSVVMANHPGITAEDAMTIIVNQYLREETFQYMDETTNGQLVDGGQWYFIEIQQLLDHELLQADQLNSLQFDAADEVELPFNQGLCYAGLGVQFEYEGQKYDCIEANLSTLKEALKSGTIKWYWSKDRFRKYVSKDSTTLKAYIIDCNYNRIPDLQLEVTKYIQ